MRNLFKKFGLMILGLLFALVILELLLRFLGFVYTSSHKPPQGSGSDYRIFCVGESITWGIGSSDPVPGRYPRLLEKSLYKACPNTRFSCMFDQTIGQNTSEILFKLPRYISLYSPHMVILMVGANNWWNLENCDGLLFSGTPISRASFRVLMFCDKFRTWKLIKNIGYSLGLYKERWNYWFPKDKEGEKNNWVKRDFLDLDLFDEIAEHDIDEMVRICKNKGIKVVICNYPMGGGPKLNVIQKDLAKKWSCPFVDNYGLFQRLGDRRSYLWKDNWHPNDKGYVLMTDNILKGVLSSGLLDDCSSSRKDKGGAKP